MGETSKVTVKMVDVFPAVRTLQDKADTIQYIYDQCYILLSLSRFLTKKGLNTTYELTVHVPASSPEKKYLYSVMSFIFKPLGKIHLTKADILQNKACGIVALLEKNVPILVDRLCHMVRISVCSMLGEHRIPKPGVTCVH